MLTALFLGAAICQNACVRRAALFSILLMTLCMPGLVGAAERGQSAPATSPAKGRLLIAGRNLGDPNFAEAVILLLAHGEHGSMGIIINQPSQVSLASALPDVKELRERSDRVFLGGPVAGNAVVLLIRSKSPPRAAQQIFDDVYATGNLSTLRAALARSGKTERLRAYVGYAGWGAGQLDREIARGDWHVVPADAATIFDATPADIWSKLIARFSAQWTMNSNRLLEPGLTD